MNKVGNHCSNRCILILIKKNCLQMFLDKKSNVLIVEVVFESKNVNI